MLFIHPTASIILQFTKESVYEYILSTTLELNRMILSLLKDLLLEGAYYSTNSSPFLPSCSELKISSVDFPSTRSGKSNVSNFSSTIDFRQHVGVLLKSAK